MPPPETHRDHGLVRGIGVTGMAASIVNVVVGAGIFTLPAAIALQAGSAGALSYLVCAVLMAGVVLCFAEAGSRVPTSGGVYGAVDAAFGPAAGFVCGILLIVSDMLASGGIAAAVADMIGAQLPLLARSAGRLAMIAAIYGLITAANLTDVRTTARIITGTTAIKLIPLVLFVLLGVITWHHAPPAGPPIPPPSAAGFARSIIIGLFAFEGMECALINSGEVQDPNRTIPRALFISMIGILLLYLGIQLSAQHLLGPALPHAAAPLADAAGLVSQPIRLLLLGGAGLSMLGFLASDMLATPRMIFAFARDGLLPGWFAWLHPRKAIPTNAILAYVACAFLTAISGSFLELVVLASLAVVAIYVMACAAAYVLQRRDVARAGKPLRIPGLPVAAVLGFAGMLAITVSAQWSEIGGLIATISASLALYWLMTRWRTR